MKKSIALTLAAATAALLATSVSAQEACSLYRVKPGDTLREIATTAFGDNDYTRIYNANSVEIGRNPDIIRVGMVLKLPCDNGTMPAVASEIEGRREHGSDAVMVSLLSANGYLPYSDESLPGGGIIARLAETAMVRGAPEKDVEVVFVNDWASHLEELLPRKAFDASFPWTEPDCRRTDTLSATDQDACENLIFSRPFYEIVETFFARKDSGWDEVFDASGFAGTTICRPEGYLTSHLDALGLREPDVTLVQPVDPSICFQALNSGEVELVSLDTRAGERLIHELGLQLVLVENPNVFSIMPLQVAAHRNNPAAQSVIDDLNRGLEIMNESGEWASIVTEGLQRQTEALMN